MVSRWPSRRLRRSTAGCLWVVSESVERRRNRGTALQKQRATRGERLVYGRPIHYLLFDRPFGRSNLRIAPCGNRRAQADRNLSQQVSAHRPTPFTGWKVRELCIERNRK